jgi:hypothetical protein
MLVCLKDRFNIEVIDHDHSNTYNISEYDTVGIPHSLASSGIVSEWIALLEKFNKISTQQNPIDLNTSDSRNSMNKMSKFKAR